MPFKDYAEFAEHLELPINGKTYKIPPVSAALGLQLLDLEKNGEKSTMALAKKQGMELWHELLGSAWDEMLADEVPLGAVSRAGLVVLTDYRFGREMAEHVWEAGLDPEAVAAAVTAANSGTALKRSLSSAAATTTPSRASMTGTTSPKATPQRAKRARAPKASPGPR